MTDISKCQGYYENTEQCKKKEQCYRYTAPNNQDGFQLWFIAPVAKDENCEFFMEQPSK